MNANIVALTVVIIGTGCAQRNAHHVTNAQASPPSSARTGVLSEVCLRPSGVCTRLKHGVNCAFLPFDEKEVWSGTWYATTIEPGDYQPQELRNYVCDGWWFKVPSTLPDGRISGPIIVMKPKYDDSGQVGPVSPP